MKKKRRKPPHGGDPMMVTTLSRWGTKAQGKLHERERAYKNRIHELETALAGAQAVIKNQTEVRQDLQRKLDDVAGPRLLHALRKVCLLPISDAMDLGVDEPLLVLCAWLAKMEGVDHRVSSGKPSAAADVHPASVFPTSMSGITKQIADADDSTSVDNLFARCVDVHLERMEKGYYWLGLTPIGGQTVHIDIVIDKSRTMRARVRT